MKPLVLFDGACPLCRREITHYRRLRSSMNLEWRDVSQEPVDDLNLKQEAVLRRMHVRDHQGQWQIGASAFLTLWSSLAGYRYLAMLLRGMRLEPLLNRLYEWFAARRYRKQCETGLCGVGESRKLE